MAVESKSNDCLETMSLRKSRLCSPLSSSRLVMMILMQSRTKTVHEKIHLHTEAAVVVLVDAVVIHDTVVRIVPLIHVVFVASFASWFH